MIFAKCKIRMLSILVLSVSLGSCATSPTGRNQLMLVSDVEMSQMGMKAYDQIKRKEKISNSPAETQYVRCVANQIIAQLPPRYANQAWEVNLFQDDSPNAFALPGGKVGVNTGIFKVAKNQHQLAAVVAHEIGHVIAQHGAERMSASLATELGMKAVEIAAGVSGQPLGQGVVSALGMGAQYGIVLPFGRTQESEADRIGLNLMAKAGFDPQQAIDLWQNMARSGGPNPPEFLSTHPSDTHRMADLNANMVGALQAAQLAHQAGRNPQCGTQY